MMASSRKEIRAVLSGSCLIGIALLLSVRVVAQTPPLTFDIASVKSNQADDPPTTLFPLGPGDAFAETGGLFRATNQPLIAYVRFAYRLGPSELRDLPRWVYNERFDIAARVNGTPTKVQMREMMRSLLAERFRLVVHSDQETQAIYELVPVQAGRLGPQLRVHRNESCDAPSTFQLPSLPCGTVGFVTSGTGEKARITANGES